LVVLGRGTSVEEGQNTTEKGKILSHREAMNNYKLQKRGGMDEE